MGGERVRAGFERKFLVPEECATALLSDLGRLLAFDPLAGPDGRYAVASLYLDTPDLAIYRREAADKWRLRRYDDSAIVYAERKAKPAPGSVVKRRTAFAIDEMTRLDTPEADWPGAWFVREVYARGLAPSRIVGYERHAFVGTLGAQEVRVTLDHRIQGARALCRALPEPGWSGTPLVEGRILEVKFEADLPAPLGSLLAAYGLEPAAISKYRRAVERA